MLSVSVVLQSDCPTPSSGSVSLPANGVPPNCYPPSRWVRLIRGLDDSHVESCDDDVIRRRCSLQLTGPCLGNEPQLTVCGRMWTQRTIDTFSLLSLLQSLRTAYSYSQNHACMHALNEMKPPLLLSHHPSLDPIFLFASRSRFTHLNINPTPAPTAQSCYCKTKKKKRPHLTAIMTVHSKRERLGLTWSRSSSCRLI
jgi:hypothetical protein